MLGTQEELEQPPGLLRGVWLILPWDTQAQGSLPSLHPCVSTEAHYSGSLFCPRSAPTKQLSIFIHGVTDKRAWALGGHPWAMSNNWRECRNALRETALVRNVSLAQGASQVPPCAPHSLNPGTVPGTSRYSIYIS